MDADARKFVDEAIADNTQPVLIFALEWCEFCWSVRKFFKKIGVEYRSVDLDSVPFQQNDRGRKIRVVLAERTSVKTIPQIFIGGQFIGGCTDLFDAWKDGRIQQLLNANQVEYEKGSAADPYSYLPDWLHPR